MSGKKSVPIVAVLNMKGGVGKTTISAHVFRVLFEKYKAGTLLLDIDPQFNLTQTLFKRSEYDKIKAAGHTILSVMEPSPSTGLFEIKVTSEPPPSPDAIGRTLFHFPKMVPAEKLTIISGDFGLVKYSLMDDNRKLGAVKSRFLKFIDHAKTKYKIICIDCNPSSSFLTLCALEACTHIIVPVRPDRYSVLGLEILSDFVDAIPSIHPKPQIVVVLNGIPRTQYDRSVEDELRAHPVFGSQTLADRLYQTKLLMAHPDYTGFASDKRVPWSNTLRAEITAVATEMAGRLGIQ